MGSLTYPLPPLIHWFTFYICFLHLSVALHPHSIWRYICATMFIHMLDTTQLGLYDLYCPQSGHTPSNALALPHASPYFWKFLNLSHYPTCKVLTLLMSECKMPCSPMPCDIHIFRLMILFASHLTMGTTLG